MGWEDGDPLALGDPPPRLDLTSNQQTSPANRAGLGQGKAVSAPHSLCSHHTPTPHPPGPQP